MSRARELANIGTSIATAANATAINIDSSERVGLGTTAPSSHLVVDGAGTGWRGQFMIIDATTGDNADPYMTFWSGSETGSGSTGLLGQIGFQSSGDNKMQVNNYTGGDLILQGGGQGGNVGIGTAAPDSNLHLKSDSGDAVLEIETVSGGDSTITMKGFANRNNVINFEDNTGIAGRIIYDHNDNEFQFYTNGISTADMVIDDDGNVGIGVVAPDAKLWVAGDIGCFQASGDARISMGTGTSHTGGNYGYIEWDDSSDVITIGTQTGGDTLFVSENRNVGIGTVDNLTGLLEVKTSSSSFSMVSKPHANAFGDWSGIGFKGGNTTEPVKGGIIFETKGGWGIGDMHFLTNSSATNGAVDVNNDRRMTITNTGKVGIGYSSHHNNSILNINGKTTIAELTGSEMNDVETVPGDVDFTNSWGLNSGTINNASTWTTTAPGGPYRTNFASYTLGKSYRFRLVGSSTISGTAYAGYGDAQSVLNYPTGNFDITGDFTAQAVDTGGIYFRNGGGSGSTTITKISIFELSSTTGNFVAGRFGIGTVAPQGAMHIIGAAQNYQDTGTTRPYPLKMFRTDNETAHLFMGVDLSVAPYYCFISAANPGYTIPNLILNKEGGNVGIGNVTDPDNTLEIAGSLHVQGQTTFDSNLLLKDGAIYNANITYSQNTWLVIVPTGTANVGSGRVYIVTIAAHSFSGGSPYYADTTFLWKCSPGTNSGGNGSGQTYLTSHHVGSSSQWEVRSTAAVSSANGLEARLNSGPAGSATVAVKLTRLM